MEKGVQIGNNLSGRHVYVPHVDESPVPCENYTCTDCVYLPEDVDVGYFGIGPKSSVSSLMNALVCRMREQDREIEYLKQQIKMIKDNGNNW